MKPIHAIHNYICVWIQSFLTSIKLKNRLIQITYIWKQYWGFVFMFQKKLLYFYDLLHEVILRYILWLRHPKPLDIAPVIKNWTIKCGKTRMFSQKVSCLCFVIAIFFLPYSWFISLTRLLRDEKKNQSKLHVCISNTINLKTYCHFKWMIQYGTNCALSTIISSNP